MINLIDIATRAGQLLIENGARYAGLLGDTQLHIFKKIIIPHAVFVHSH